jgi:predicted HD phosphohydrolase
VAAVVPAVDEILDGGDRHGFRPHSRHTSATLTAVDQRRHALQCAGHAVAAGSDDELVLAAALHDIGRAEPVRAEFPGLPHEQAGAAFARDRIGEGVAWLIGQHVPAKRYLVAVDEAYFGQLSPAPVG